MLPLELREPIRQAVHGQILAIRASWWAFRTCSACAPGRSRAAAPVRAGRAGAGRRAGAEPGTQAGRHALRPRLALVPARLRGADRAAKASTGCFAPLIYDIIPVVRGRNPSIPCWPRNSPIGIRVACRWPIASSPSRGPRRWMWKPGPDCSPAGGAAGDPHPHRHRLLRRQPAHRRRAGQSRRCRRGWCRTAMSSSSRPSRRGRITRWPSASGAGCSTRCRPTSCPPWSSPGASAGWSRIDATASELEGLDGKLVVVEDPGRDAAGALPRLPLHPLPLALRGLGPAGDRRARFRQGVCIASDRASIP